MTDKAYFLSKTSFLKFEQCDKAFFLYKNHPYLRDKLTVDKQLTFKRGHDVGYYAQKLFPGGVDVSKETKNTQAALELTQQLIEEQKTVIYEATFQHNGVLVMADILCLENGVYTAYEIKSSLKVSETYLKDAQLQYYIIKNRLPNLEDFFLVTLNQDYVLETNEPDPRKLFKRRSIKHKATENMAYFEHRILVARQVQEQNAIPNTAIGRHCFRPYQCDFFGTCWKNMAEGDSIFNLPLVDKNTQFEWFNSGIKSMNELEAHHFAKPYQLQIKNALTTHSCIVNIAAISNFINKIKVPYAAMDMEIWNPAIPQLPNTRPFEQIPFLVCFFDGKNYSAFFTAHQSDARRDFAINLIKLSDKYASILVYDKTMELAVIENLIKAYPEFAEPLTALKEKLLDIFDIFLNIDYYDPAFKSNFSLKGVSSVLLKNVEYSSITSGLEAMNYYDQYRQTELPFEKERLKQELTDYCNTDCAATFGIAEFLATLT